MEGKSKMSSKCGQLFHRILVTRKMNLRRVLSDQRPIVPGSPQAGFFGAPLQRPQPRREEPFTIATGRDMPAQKAEAYQGTASLKVKLEAVRPAVKVLRVYDLENRNRPPKRLEQASSCPRLRLAAAATLDTNLAGGRGPPAPEFAKQLPQKSYRDLSRERQRLANLEYQPTHSSVEPHLPLIFIPKTSRREDRSTKAPLGCNSFFLDVNIGFTRDSRLQNAFNFQKYTTRKGMEKKRVCLNDDFNSGLDQKGVGEAFSRRRFGEFCKSERVFHLAKVTN